MKSLACKIFLLSLMFIFLISFNISIGANRADLPVSQALIGTWQPAEKTWFGSEKKQLDDTTFHKFASNGIYTLIQSIGTKHMQYSIREENDHENWIMVYIKVPETGKGHIKIIKFSPDKTSAKVETHWSYTSVKKKKKNITTGSTWYFVEQ